MNSEEVLSLPWDEPIVANYEILRNGFVAFLTSKRLMTNILKQMAASDKLTKGADGTYKLNTGWHPTIISGVYDVQNRLHMSTIINFFI